MRRAYVFVLCFVAVATPQVALSFNVGASNPGEAQVRTPDTDLSQPETRPRGTNKKTVNVAELKIQAQELITMSQALPGQLEQIGGGKLPKDLIGNLKKIEKLAKHIRSELE